MQPLDHTLLTEQLWVDVIQVLILDAWSLEIKGSSGPHWFKIEIQTEILRTQLLLESIFFPVIIGFWGSIMDPLVSLIVHTELASYFAIAAAV